MTVVAFIENNNSLLEYVCAFIIFSEMDFSVAFFPMISYEFNLNIIYNKSQFSKHCCWNIAFSIQVEFS